MSIIDNNMCFRLDRDLYYNNKVKQNRIVLMRNNKKLTVYIYNRK